MDVENKFINNDVGKVVASIKGLNKCIGKKTVLENIEFDIKAGQVTAILGSNGAGKTTLINTLLGRLTADSGTLAILGLAAGVKQVKKRTGALLQIASLPETLKVKEFIQLFQSYYPAPMSYDKIIAYSALEDLQHRYAKKLSGGEKQRLLFALSLCGNPKLLFLDEPTVGVDAKSRQGVWRAIRDLKAQGTAIVLTTHYLDEADNLADEIILIKAGKIIKKGTVDQIKNNVRTSTLRFISPNVEADFSSLPCVVNISTENQFTLIQTLDVNLCLSALLSKFPEVSELTVFRASLEEAFIQINEGEAA